MTASSPRLGRFSCLLALLWLPLAAAAQTAPATAPSLVPATRAARAPVWPPMDPKLPTFWIIGDSTVRNGQDTGNNGQWGWGNPIASFFDRTRINVQNRAMGGTSSRSYQNAPELWGDVISHFKPGDYLIMQFGHNDGGKPDDPSRARASLRGNGEETQEIDNPITRKHEVVHTYGWYIRQYIKQAKEKGASEVVVCSPIPRNRWTNGNVNRDTTYSLWAQDAAQQEGALYLDLNKLVADAYDQTGEQKVTDTYFPEKETVHPDWAGAVLNAQLVLKGLQDLDSQLKTYLLPVPPQNLQNPTGKPR